MGGIASIIGSIPWFGWIAIIAIVSSAISQCLRWHYQHVERMEMIRQGMNPDAIAGVEKAYEEQEI